MEGEGGQVLAAVRLEPGAVFAALVDQLWAEGVAVLPIDRRLPAGEIDRILTLTRPRYLVSSERRVELPDWDPVEAGTAVVLLTSGSAGEPKPVELSHDALKASATAVHFRLTVVRDDRWVCCVPLNHIAGFGILVRSRMLGIEMESHDLFDPEAIGRSEGNLISLVPTQLHRLLEASVDLRRFKAILVGGAAIHPELLARARGTGANIVRSYGMTETCGGVVYDGRPLDPVDVRVDQQGHIRISSPTLMTRYRGMPELTNAKLRDGWFQTSDLGRMEGDRLVVTGRADEIIVTGGEKVAPPEVEAELLEHPLVADAVVFPVDDAEWGQRVVAVVVPVPGDDIPRPEALMTYLKERVAPYKVPKEVILTATIPRLTTNEPDLDSLRALLT